LVAATASAQSIVPVAKPVSFGVAGGVSVPTGDFSNGVKSGYNLSGLVEYQAPAWPVALRLEGQWQQFKFKELDNGSDKLIGGLANALYYIPSKSIVRPYITGGLGFFHITADYDGESESANKFAYDLGAGLQFRLTGMSTFVEANWQSVQTEGYSSGMIPIRVGVKF
jgi:opacity protein-like surface antigen